MSYIQFTNRVVPAKKWYEEGNGLVAPNRFRYFDKECNRRKERREVKALIKSNKYSEDKLKVSISF